MYHPDIDSTEAAPQVLIVGGGFAGIWAAMAAARTASELGGVRIDVLTPDDRFVPRPRLYEGGAAEKAVPLSQVLDPIGVGHVRGLMTGIDLDASEVTSVNDAGEQRRVRYDRLILASGSRLDRPTIDATHLHDIDTIEGAARFDARLDRLPDGGMVAIVGGGFTGIELACELPARAPSAHVVLIDRSPAVGRPLGPHARPVIHHALDELGIERLHGVSVTSYDGTMVELSDGTSFGADIVVWTTGMRASPLTSLLSDDLDPLGRIKVDQHLRVSGASGVFAAGDTAAPLDSSGHTVMQSAQHAIPQGACAGHNAVADLLGGDLMELQTMPYGTCLDLGSAGAVYTEGWSREVILVGDEAKALKRDINTTWIYPPMTVPIT